MRDITTARQRGIEADALMEEALVREQTSPPPPLPAETTAAMADLLNAAMQQDDNQMQQENNMMQQQNNNMYENRIFRQYLRERNFRLARMSAQFPRYVRPEQIQRWTTASTYDDTLLARDPAFIQSNPSLVRASTARKTTSSIRSFGGGSSAGGRGGRW